MLPWGDWFWWVREKDEGFQQQWFLIRAQPHDNSKQSWQASNLAQLRFSQGSHQGRCHSSPGGQQACRRAAAWGQPGVDTWPLELHPGPHKSRSAPRRAWASLGQVWRWEWTICGWEGSSVSKWEVQGQTGTDPERPHPEVSGLAQLCTNSSASVNHGLGVGWGD